MISSPAPASSASRECAAARRAGIVPGGDVTLSIPERNRLARLVLEAFGDEKARSEIAALAAGCAEDPSTAELGARAARARALFADRPLEPDGAGLDRILGRAALLFDARFYFEVHELLEPLWLRAAGADRQALQGLIQIAAGFHHLSNGNAAGARALLHDGAGKLLSGAIGGVPLDAFARAVISILDEVIRLGEAATERFSWSSVPRLPVASPLGCKDINS
jgi:Domain of unknown function (DUF309)